MEKKVKPQMQAITLLYKKKDYQPKRNYSWISFSQSLEETNVEGVDSGSTDFLLVLVQPQVVSSEIPHVELISSQV